MTIEQKKINSGDQDQREEKMLNTGICIDCSNSLNDDGYCHNCGQYKIETLRPHGR